jgi:hypothetical protein
MVERQSWWKDTVMVEGWIFGFCATAQNVL